VTVAKSRVRAEKKLTAFVELESAIRKNSINTSVLVWSTSKRRTILNSGHIRQSPTQELGGA